MSNKSAIFCASFALLAFAGNSVLCRLALRDSAIDPASFTSIRLIAGALFLWVLVARQSHSLFVKPATKEALFAPASLFVYALCFSYAYIELDTGTGALILFGVVQISLLLISVIQGKRPSYNELGGMCLAVVGLAWLLLPGAGAPSLVGFVLMAVAGLAWAAYTYLGSGATQPVLLTARNFIWALPAAIVVGVYGLVGGLITFDGIILASASGALTSGLGYALWYAALKFFTVVQAAVVQLLVPVIAILGGVVFVSEPVSLSLVVCSLLVLGGVLITILGRKRSV